MPDTTDDKPNHLKYIDRAEFIRFQDIVLDAQNEIRRLNIFIEKFQQRVEEALKEIERLFESHRWK